MLVKKRLNESLFPAPKIDPNPVFIGLGSIYGC